MATMNERERRALVCLLVKEMGQTDSWAAETHIQKCVYFLQEMMKVPVGYDYILYKHGPLQLRPSKRVGCNASPLPVGT